MTSYLSSQSSADVKKSYRGLSIYPHRQSLSSALEAGLPGSSGRDSSRPRGQTAGRGHKSQKRLLGNERNVAGQLKKRQEQENATENRDESV